MDNSHDIGGRDVIEIQSGFGEELEGILADGFDEYADTNVAKVILAQRKPTMTGKEGLVGQLAQARTALEPDGKVFLKGELWDATALDGPIQAGETVEIVAADGFRLQVKKTRSH